MDKDITTAYAILSGILGALFGLAPGIFFCVVAGSFLSLRFCETKTVQAAMYHLTFSIIIVCIVTGEVQNKLPEWLSVKIFGLLGGFLFMLLAEMLYVSVKSFNFGQKINVIWDKVVDKWTR